MVIFESVMIPFGRGTTLGQLDGHPTTDDDGFGPGCRMMAIDMYDGNGDFSSTHTLKQDRYIYYGDIFSGRRMELPLSFAFRFCEVTEGSL